MKYWACIKEMQNANKKIAFYSSTKKYLCSFALNQYFGKFLPKN